MRSYPCDVCGNQVEMFECHKKRTKYIFCSEKCHDAPIIEKACKVCDKKFKVSCHDSNVAAYCSNECHNAYLRNKWKTDKGKQVTLTCKQCEKRFGIRSTLKDKQEFCSIKCFYDSGGLGAKSGKANHNWKEKVDVVCQTCGKQFQTFPSRKDRAKYCSKQCSTAAHLDRFKSGKRTNLEQKMLEALTNSRLTFTEQVVMFDKFMVDFLLTKNKVVIQCDGIYWHDRPKTKGRDRGQDSYLAEAGYIVLRFTDKQILNHIDSCIAIIKKTIKTKQLPLINW